MGKIYFYLQGRNMQTRNEEYEYFGKNNIKEIICYCPDCGAKHQTVRPGKTQPTCNCADICEKCGNIVEYHVEADPRWPNFRGYFCNTCGPY